MPLTLSLYISLFLTQKNTHTHTHTHSLPHTHRPELHAETPMAKWQAENDAREEREGWPPRPGAVSSYEGAREVLQTHKEWFLKDLRDDLDAVGRQVYRYISASP